MIKSNAKLIEKMYEKKLEEDYSTNSFFRDKWSRSPDFTKINKLYESGRQKQIQRSASPSKNDKLKSANPLINK